MSHINNKIGFNDINVMIVAIPLLSLTIPFIFFGMTLKDLAFFNWQGFFICFITTTSIWVGNRFIMNWSRRRYPMFEDNRKRLKVQLSMMLFFTLFDANIIGFLFSDFCRIGIIQTQAYIIFHSNIASLFCTIAIAAIYESIYFMHELRKSIEEKEFLQKESLRAQLDSLKSQVNPHFLFNNLNTLSSLIPEDPEKAVVFVQQLSKVYRHILEVQDEPSIYLDKELDVVKAYAFLLQTRFGKNLGINLRVPEEKLRNKIVPLSLQILIENAIKHNIVSALKPLRIELFTNNGHVVVSNNLQKKNQRLESTGIGLNNIKNRYRLLSDQNVIITENENNFTVAIPLIETL